MPRDEIEVTILDDGKVKVETFGKISEVNHMSAERLIAALAEAYSDRPIVRRKSHVHAHAHEHQRIGGK